MTKSQKNLVYVAEFVVGIAVVVLGCLEYVDSYWSGLGGALAGVAAIRLVMAVRYARDPTYARKVEVNNSDERVAFVAGRSADMTFRLSILGLALLAIVLWPLGYTSTSRILGLVMCAETMLYWVTYMIMMRKY